MQVSLLIKSLSRCLPGVIIGVCVFSSPVIAQAQDCSIHNPQIISDSPFDISYSSWVEQVGSTFVYGRCVAVGNTQSANIDWIGAQLKGIARPGFPQLVTFPFLLESTRERDSELQYGVEPKPERNKKVKLLANEEEEDIKSKLNAFIEEQKIKAIAGESLETSISTAISTAVISFTDADGKIALDFISSFRSDLDLGKEYSYTIDYQLKASKSSDGAAVAVPEGILLVPQASLRELASQNFSDGAIPLEGGSNKIDFFFVADVNNPRERRTTQALSTMKIVQNDVLLASFPVSYFQPADLK